MFMVCNRRDNFTTISGYNKVKVKTKFGSTESERSIIQVLKIPEFSNKFDHEPNKGV